MKHTLAVAVRYRCDAVVVDSYHVDADYLERLRAAGLFVVAIDDLARYPFPCQLVVNGGAHAHHLPYRSPSGDTRFLLGPQYALLRPEFWDVALRTVRDTVQNILVTLGGADPHSLMPRLLSLLDDLPGNFTVTAIVGPFFENRAKVEGAARSCRRLVRLVDAPDSVLDLMLEADLAISGGGQTLYELAATGTPTIAIASADNQRRNVRYMKKQGVVKAIELKEDQRLRNSLAEHVIRLLDDLGRRERMSRVGQRLVDGRGAIRVANVVTDYRRKHAKR